jgi:hypothetical protein
MTKFKNFWIVFLILVAPAFAEVTKTPSIENLKWHRRTVGKFEILSLNDEQGKFLQKNLPQIKKWALTRWGFQNIPMTANCRIMCVPNDELMKKLFRIRRSKSEPFRDHEGKTIHVAFLQLDDRPVNSVAGPLTTVFLSEIEKKHNHKLGFWAHRGMNKLNATVPKIRSDFLEFKKSKKRFSAKELLKMKEKDWRGLVEKDRDLYDNQCMAMMLLLRKEFGQRNLHSFLGTNIKNPKAIWEVYGFSGYREFDESYKRYITDVTNDISKNRTPDDYLIIKEI